ncbi:MAG: aldo/keto reductase [Nitrososphaerales archaeon]|nr:aldo/keto reductase [Nitrososphaerales archaeon]
MEYRTLGKTNEKVSVVGMGTWKMGLSRTPAERAKQITSLKRGLELGMTLVDTAEAYGDGKAEELVGDAIRENRNAAFVATKVSPGNLHREDVLAACRKSLDRLGIRHVDLYQVHWPNPRIPIKETMGAMEKLVQEGKVRYIGVSNFSAEQTKEAREALAKNELVSNQVEYSLTNRIIESDLLPFCEREGITVIAYSPLGRGSIPVQSIPKPIMDRYGLSPAQVALNWVTFRESVVAIPKSARKEHTEENAGSVSVRLSQEDYGLISSQAL